MRAQELNTEEEMVRQILGTGLKTFLNIVSSTIKLGFFNMTQKQSVNIKDIIMIEYTPPNRIVYQQFYIQFLTKYRRGNNMPRFVQWQLLHYNTLIQKQLWSTRSKVKTNTVPMHKYASCSADLVSVSSFFPQIWRVCSKELIFSQVKYTKENRELLKALSKYNVRRRVKAWQAHMDSV